MVFPPQQLAYSGAFPTGHFVHVSGPRTISDDTLRVFESLVLESYGPEPKPQSIRRRAKVPPAPRLVGIETNPGPPGRSVRRGVSAAEKALAIIDTLRQGRLVPPMRLAPAKKKKKKTVNAVPLTNTRTVTDYLTAPVSVGVRSRAGITHTPFVMKGRCIAFSGGGDPTGVPIASSLVGVGTANWFNVDPATSSTLVANFQSFPTAIRNITTSFQRYRFRKLTLDYTPTIGTSSGQSLILGITPECGINASTISNQNISTFQLNITSPVWAPIKDFDLLAEGGLRKDWCFVATEFAATRSTERQESPGSISFGYLGANFNGTFGWFYYNYEIEFTGVGIESAFSNSAPSSSSSSSSSTVPVVSTMTPPGPSVHEPEYGIVYGPAAQGGQSHTSSPGVRF